jgi:hypothetical protein
MFKTEELRLKNVRSTRKGRNSSLAENIMRLYRIHPHYPYLADEIELKKM